MSKAADLKRRKLRNAIKAGLPDLAPVEARAKQGKARMAEIEEDNTRGNLEARARRMGKPTDNLSALNYPMLSEDAGMALSLKCTDAKAKELWQHYVAITAAEARYHRSIGKSVHPKCAKIEMMQERFEVDASDNVDMRTEDERDRAAQAAWMRWQGILGHLNARQQTAIQQAVRGGVDLVASGRATSHGERFVYAMMALDDVVG